MNSFKREKDTGSNWLKTAEQVILTVRSLVGDEMYALIVAILSKEKIHLEIFTGF